MERLTFFGKFLLLYLRKIGGYSLKELGEYKICFSKPLHYNFSDPIYDLTNPFMPYLKADL